MHSPLVQVSSQTGSHSYFEFFLNLYPEKHLHVSGAEHSPCIQFIVQVGRQT